MTRREMEKLPPLIRELIDPDFSRENRDSSPGGPLPPPRPQEPAASALSSPASPKMEPATSNRHSASKETGAAGRQSNGRFAKGNPGGCGNPFARQVAAFRACLINSVTEDDFKAIMYELLEEAKDGNLQAIKLLFSYLLGTPKPVVEPDELDLNEMHLAHQADLAAEALRQATPASPSANDAPPTSGGLVERPATSAPEVSASPLACAPSTNGTNRESCPPTVSEAPSTNRTSDVTEADNPSRPPSTNQLNGKPTADVSNTCPSTNGPNRKHEPRAVCGTPRRQAVDADEKQT